MADSRGLNPLRFIPLKNLPLIEPGADLALLIGGALRDSGELPAHDDIIAVAQKVVSKAERRSVLLRTVEPSAEARDIAARANKDPRVVELILRESRAIIRVAPGVIIAEHRTGLILANAGIDRSNIPDSEDYALLLPIDADRSAAGLRQRLEAEFKVPLGILITDSIGRPWRLGTTGTAIGSAGIISLHDLRGQADLFGRPLQVSEVAVADSLAAAAVLVMGEAAEGTPLVLIRGAESFSNARGGNAELSRQNARTTLRDSKEDLFR